MNFLTDYSIGLISPIALLQLCALPGLILSLKLQIKQNILIYISLVFVNSLVINHILVLVLTTLKIFIHPLVIILATFEIVFIFIKIDTVYQSINQSWQITKNQIRLIQLAYENKVFFIVSIITLITSIAFLLFSFYDVQTNSFFQVFTNWDDVVSWNAWAITWSENNFPSGTWEYPQLLPTNWALTYVMLNNNQIQFVSNFLMDIFPIIGVLSIAGLGLSMSNLEILFSAGFTGYILKSSMWTGTGYADIPVSIFACILFSYYYSLYFQERAKILLFSPQSLLSLALIGAGAITTKQTGIFLIFCFALIYLINNLNVILRNSLLVRSLVYFFSPILIISSLWYLIKYLVLKDYSSNAVLLVSSPVLHPDSFVARRIFLSIIEFFSSHRLLLFSVIFALIPQKKNLKFLTEIIYFYCLPWALIWGAFYSYDNRNIQPIYTSLGLAGGAIFFSLVIKVLLKFFSLSKYKINTKSLNVLVVIVNLFFVYFFSHLSYYPNSVYLDQQQLAKLHIGNYNLNSKLLNYFGSIDSNKSESIIVATDYQLMNYIPGLSNYYRPSFLQSYEEEIASVNDPEVGYLLYANCPKDKNNLPNHISLVFVVDNSCLYKKNN